MEMESEKDNEKKDRIATIFMYEARIKDRVEHIEKEVEDGLKASIPEPKELTEISTQTDHPSQDESEKSLFSDSDQDDQSDQIPKTVMSAQPRLSGASNEIQPTE